MLKAVIVYLHVLAMIGGFTAIIVIETKIYRNFKNFSVDDFVSIRTLSNLVTVSLGLLWISGVLLVFVGYLNDPNYVTNQKIWGKVAMVSVMTINGFYISYRIMPRIQGLQNSHTLVRNHYESVVFRISFALSLAGWMLASFLGTARFMNHTYHMFSILNFYALTVLCMFILSYLFQRAEFLQPEEQDVACQQTRQNGPEIQS